MQFNDNYLLLGSDDNSIKIWEDEKIEKINQLDIKEQYKPYIKLMIIILLLEALIIKFIFGILMKKNVSEL